MSKDKIALAGMTFTGDVLMDGRCYIGNSIVGDELTIDTVDVTVRSGTDLSTLRYGEAARYYHGSDLLGKFYLEAAQRTGKAEYALSLISGVGLLDRAPNTYGGLYLGETVATVLAAIIGDIVPYTVDDAFGALPVYGWLPVCNRRDALRQLLFAMGGCIRKDAAGEIYITRLSMDTPQVISEDRLYEGGSVRYPDMVTVVTVVEHSYRKTSADEQVTLYEDAVTVGELVSPNGAKLTGALITFDEPVYGLTITGGTILESGCNYAVLGPGSFAVLKGMKYAHSTREVQAAVAGASGEAKEARVEDGTLINFVNSEAVAQRVAKYYAASRTLSMDMVVGPERPGDAVRLEDPFGDNAVALLMSMDINMGNTLAAGVEMVVGYAAAQDWGYEHAAIVTDSGSWPIPAGVTQCRVVLIGGGDGGQAGRPGEEGETGKSCTVRSGSGTWSATGEGGKGGAGGQCGVGGAGGKTNVIAIDVPEGAASMELSIGAGGLGGAEAGQPGGAGGATTLTVGGTVYSSADGTSNPAGFFELLSGQILGSQGAVGTNGTPGGAGVEGCRANENDNFQEGDTAAVGARGTDFPPNTGGAGGVGSYNLGGNDVVGYQIEVHSDGASNYRGGDTVSGYTSYRLDQETGEFELLNYKTIQLTSGWYIYEPAANYGGRPAIRRYKGTYSTYAVNTSLIVSQRKWGTAYGKGRGGAGGGGAAVGGNGGDGQVNVGGAGAAAAQPAPATTPGAGGAGGNGGGGGGGGGGAYLLVDRHITKDYTCDGGPGGSGGAGSSGGNGAKGCAIIYY